MAPRCGRARRRQSPELDGDGAVPRPPPEPPPHSRRGRRPGGRRRRELLSGAKVALATFVLALATPFCGISPANATLMPGISPEKQPKRGKNRVFCGSTTPVCGVNNSFCGPDEATA